MTLLARRAPPPLKGNPFLRLAIGSLYVCATLQFIRFYTVTTTLYLNLPAYLSGHERLPFQERILPALLINIWLRLPHPAHLATHADGAFTANRAPVYVLAVISIFVAGYFTQLLYRSVSINGSLSYLVYPVFLYSMLWSYTVHLEANYAYPYDIPSVAFFSAGLYFIYIRKFWALFFVILVGTINRETTLFLIGIFAIDAVSTHSTEIVGSLLERFSLTQLPWAKLAGLLTVWLAIKLLLSHVYAHNSHAEDYVRIRENFGRLKPRLWPALLNICGYLLPAVLLLRRDIRPQRFQNYLWIVPLWLGIMFYTGVILETRIYGELCPYVSVALVLIIEHRIGQRELLPLLGP